MNITKAGMAWLGVVSKVSPIDGADMIQRADVVCGTGGAWSGVVGKELEPGAKIVAFLPDSIVPQSDATAFMEKHGWRVKMMRLRGCPSEVLIVPASSLGAYGEIGTDVTEQLGVLKYEKEIPLDMSGEASGAFPSFIPKTDEPNFQTVSKLRLALLGNPCYAATKYDGTSHTFFHKDGEFGGCSRNWQLKEGSGGVWALAEKYKLKEKLPQFGNVALQWECVGPKIQGNPLKLTECEARLFDVFNIDKQEYSSLEVLDEISEATGIPLVQHTLLGRFGEPTNDELRDLARGTYLESGKTREGIVIRPTTPLRCQGERVSFKVINLDYKEAV